MCGKRLSRFSLALLSGLVLFGFSLLLSPMKLQANEPENVSRLLRESNSTVNDSLTTGVALSNVISDWSANSKKLNEDMQSLFQELETFSDRLNRVSNMAKEQASLSQSYLGTLESSSKSITNYIELTEKQFREVEKERQAAIEKLSRWRTVAIGLAAVAVAEGVILFVR